MAKIPFKVSARTARLIGSQNFSSADGAIIELVKNCYDADARHCIVFFDNRFAEIPESLSREEYDSLLKEYDIIERYYSLTENRSTYALDLGLNRPLSLNESEKRETLQKLEEERAQLREFFNSKTALYIIDDGEGMTDDVIRDFWMVIGTNNKEDEIYTHKGRIKTGAKGIGRFALDRLGATAEMVTKPSAEKYPKADSDTGYVWEVDWTDFDGGGKIIGDIKANLVDIKPVNFVEYVTGIVPAAQLKKSNLRLSAFTNGTCIKIMGLKEAWDRFYVDRVFSSLEVLIPPTEGRKFDIYVFATAFPDNYGRVNPSICDDYDYKLTASVDGNGLAEILLYRNEYDLSLFPKAFFEQRSMQGERFSKATFGKEPVRYQRTLAQLLPGYREQDEKHVLPSIGAFEFAFYFMKGQTAKKDKERFLYKDFDVNARKEWLASFAGIRIFRDDFRVRPYGEPNGNAFDWLDLGSRAAASPAGIGKEGGGYKVRPNNVAGVINISRVTNIKLEDKSNREGIQENEVFWVFKQIIIKLIEEFENDRAYVGRELSQWYEETHTAQVTEEQAAEILAKVKQSAKSKKPTERKTEDERDKEILAQLITQREEEIDELKNEQQLLRVLASNALTIASFTHELRSIEKNLVNRVDEAEKQFRTVVDEEKCMNLADYLDPFIMLSDIRRDDVKLKEWLGYSLNTLRKDRRRRKNVDLHQYFDEFQKSWQGAFLNRGVKFKAKLPTSTPLKIRIFEIDLDCIFNNLITNSFEAFSRRDAPPERRIVIQLQVFDADVTFTYRDSGPGLSADIVDPNRIFEPHFTTKRDVHTGEDIGTGLGMWLVKSFVEDNKGSVQLLEGDPGFGIKMHFPNKLRGKIS